METVRFYKMRNLIILITLSLLALLFVYMDEASKANKKVMYVLSHDNGKESLLFDDFSEALPPVFDEVFTMQDGLMRALKNGYSVIVTEKGKILPGEYLRIKEFKEDLSSVKSKDKKWGFIDRSGKIVITFEYEDAGNFTPVSGPLILFKKNDKYGAIDTEGNIVVPANFDNLNEVTKDKNYIKIKETRDKKTPSNKDVSVYNENGKYGLTDQEAIKKIESADFYNVCSFVDGFAHVEKNGHSFLIDKTGTPVLNGKDLRRVDWKDIYACGRRGDFGFW